MAPRVDLTFCDYYNLDTIELLEQNYNFTEDIEDIESEYDISESESDDDEDVIVLYEITFTNGVKKVFMNIDNMHSKDIEEFKNIYETEYNDLCEEARINSVNTLNGKYLFHPLAVLIQENTEVFCTGNPFDDLNYIYDKLKTISKYIYDDFKNIYDEREINYFDDPILLRDINLLEKEEHYGF
jgi:hypothetical protein